MGKLDIDDLIVESNHIVNALKGLVLLNYNRPIRGKNQKKGIEYDDILLSQLLCIQSFAEMHSKNVQRVEEEIEGWNK